MRVSAKVPKRLSERLCELYVSVGQLVRKALEKRLSAGREDPLIQVCIARAKKVKQY